VALTGVAGVVEAPAEQARPVAPAIPLTQVREMFATVQEGKPAAGKWRYAILAAALLAVALLSVYGWKAWYRSSIASRASQPAAGALTAPAESENAAAGAGSASTSDIVHPSPRSLSRSSSRPGKSPTLSAAKPVDTVPDEVVRRPSRSTRPAERGRSNGGTQSKSVENGEEIPQIAASGDSADLGKALVTAAALPTLGVPISKGTAGGVLVYKVQPVYPAQARRMRVQGDVVIDALVTAQGQIDELKLVSGDSMLAAAAMDAVRRWRYTPYSLNGKPIPKQTRITVTFIAPQ
jgi:TonB family protein